MDTIKSTTLILVLGGVHAQEQQKRGIKMEMSLVEGMVTIAWVALIAYLAGKVMDFFTALVITA
jgi:hypothetical protein